MNRIAVSITLAFLFAACAQGVVQTPEAAPSPTAGPISTPTMTVEPSAMPSPTPTATAAPPCNPLKIMPLGDSITYGEGIVGYGGYRNLLGALLESDGIPFDFVGSQESAEDVLADPDNEGHPGWRISDIREAIETEGWLETYQPDIILLHIGSNDLHHVGPNHRQDVNLPDAINDLSMLLDVILTRRPEAHVIVARIIRTRWGSDSNHVLYNEAIPEIAASKGEHVSVVDMQDILLKNDFVTLYHPNPKGYDKMAHAWGKAILALGLKCSASG